MLRSALIGGDGVVTTGMILLALLRGFVPTKAQETIQGAFDTLEFLEPTQRDYVKAASVGSACRRAGIQVGSVDALIAHLAIAGNHTILTTDKDFHLAAQYIELPVWQRPN